MIKTLSEALGIVRGANPGAIKELDQAERARREAADKEAHRIAAAEAKIEQDLPAERERLMADLIDRRRRADEMAVDTIARKRLEFKHGLMSPIEIRTNGVPQRVPNDLVERHSKRLFEAPLPWDKAGRTPGQVRSEQARESSVAVDDVQARVAAKREQLERQAAARHAAHVERQAANQARKKAAGVIW